MIVNEEASQFPKPQIQTQMDDSQDPEYRPSLEDDMPSSSDSEVSVIANPSSILSPSITTKKS